MSREAADVARRAAEIMQERGICKKTYHDNEGRVCLWGAVMEAYDAFFGVKVLMPVMMPAGIYTPIYTTLERRYPYDQGLPGADFNDLPETDERDVAKVLLSVADELEVA